MSEEPDLEDRLAETSQTPDTDPSLLRQIVVHGSANALFYTPIMMMTEYLSKMEPDEMLKSRSIGALIAFSTGYLYSRSRDLWAKTFNADTESSSLKKVFVDTITGVAAMIPYALVLYAIGTSEEEMRVALPLGFMVGALTGRPYGKFLSYWSRRWGLPSVLDK